MTIDGRKLDRATQAHLRRQVVLAVRGGMTQAEAARVHGLSLRALKGDARGRPAGHTLLSQAQQAKVRGIILGKLPDQLKLPFYLWTRQAVAQLAKRECGLDLPPTTVGRYLKAWGMTAQKPVRRAYERNDAAIAAWLAEQYPLIAKQAKREGAQIYWGDEMELRSDHVSGKSYAPAGQTPLIRTTGQRFGCNMISAITNKGEMVKAVRSHLHRRQKQPTVIRNLFKEKHVRYAA